ncbi:unnamed protein product, partial [Prunus brigantina]
MEELQDAIDGYKRILNPDIQETLKISYNSLEDPVKEVFLDIACFFKGENKDRVIQILEGCGLNPEYGIKVLKDKALINVTEGNYIRIHDLLEEMGKEIVRQESPFEPEYRSRLWYHEDVDHVLTKCIVSGIIIYMGNALLRILCHLVSIIGSLSEKLYIFIYMENLKYMNFESCKFLIEFPDSSGFPNLKDLNLNNCTSLVTVHDSVGFLNNLVTLSLMGCDKLKFFPLRIALKSAKHISLYSCKSLKYFPEIVEEMECIIVLDLSYTAITELPSSIGYLVGLEMLTLEGCENLTNMPCSIYELQHLTSVSLNGCWNLVKFPKWSAESLPGNSNVSPDLWYLNLAGCKSLEEIPELPPKMERVNAADCVSLERFANFSNILEQKGEQMIESVTLFNCQKLCNNLARDLSKNQSISLNKVSLCSVIFSSQQSPFDIVFPGSEVPKWFSHREDLYNESDKSEFSFEIPLMNLENRGLAICAVVE